jgi:hypothetical protein
MLIQILTRIQERTIVNPITGGLSSVAWFQRIRVVHKDFKADREHTIEFCWCEPIITDVRPEEESHA